MADKFGTKFSRTVKKGRELQEFSYGDYAYADDGNEK